MEQSSSRAVSRIFLIDDHPIFREGFRKLLEDEPDLSVCGEAGDEKEALEKLKDLLPDLVVIDIKLARSSGLTLVEKLKRLNPNLLTMILSMHEHGDISAQALAAGARSYVTKHASPQHLIGEIRLLCAQAASHSSRAPDDGELKRRVELLSSREKDVLRLLGQGMGTRVIAEKIGISGKTVETHRGNIRNKLQLHSGADLSRFAESHFGGAG